MKLRLDIDDSVTPVAQAPRRIAMHLRERVDAKLNQLLATDIIEPVSQPSEWVSPLLVVLKDNGEIRLCSDMRRANMAIRREHHPIPNFEDFVSRLSGAKWFSRLDLKDAYYHIELDESSRHITTFITHKGMFRYKRLFFGVNCAPEAFQKILEQLISHVNNALNMQDDVFIWGATKEEHDKGLAEVMKVVKSYNIMLKPSKCEFAVHETEFLGHKISDKGFAPKDDKPDEILGFRQPKSPEEVRSFLGLVAFVSRFIPDMSAKTFHLRLLTKANQKFEWGIDQEKAFQSLKKAVSNISRLAYFDPKRRTRLVTDASPVAIGAVLVQYEDDGEDKPIIIKYASKSLSDTEKRYCQTEREALAVVWGVEHFQYYLLCIAFEVETDHRPLVPMFTPTSRPVQRIERWVLRLQPYQYKLIYRKGKENIADPFSRLAEIHEAGNFTQSWNPLQWTSLK